MKPAFRISALVLATLLAALPAAGGPTPDPARVRQCSRFCVESYAKNLPDGIFCIDACGQGHHDEPVSACSKQCVVRHIDNVPRILDCINGCGR